MLMILITCVLYNNSTVLMWCVNDVNTRDIRDTSVRIITVKNTCSIISNGHINIVFIVYLVLMCLCVWVVRE